MSSATGDPFATTLRNTNDNDDGNAIYSLVTRSLPSTNDTGKMKKKSDHSMFRPTKVPIEDLEKLIYGPLKKAYSEEHDGEKKDIEFYQAFKRNGETVYKKLNKKERDIAVQKDLFEHSMRYQMVLKAYTQSLLFTMQTKRDAVSKIKASCDPAKVFVFESLMKGIETTIDEGISSKKTLMKFDQLVELSWKLLFKKGMIAGMHDGDDKDDEDEDSDDESEESDKEN